MLIQRLTVYKQICDDNIKAATILPFYRHQIEMSNTKKGLILVKMHKTYPERYALVTRYWRP